MIGYDPNGLMIHMAHKQEVGDLLLADSSDATKTKLKSHAEEVVLKQTGVKIGHKARVCLSNGISLMGGMRPSHDHDDLNQHAVVDITEIDHWGRIHYVDESGNKNSTYMGMITLIE